VTLQSRRYRSWPHQSLWLTQRVTLVWSSTAVSRWRIMSRPSVGPATFNCVSCALSPDLSPGRRSQDDCAYMLSLHVDSTTATPCCTVLPTHYSCGCSPYRTLLPAWLRVHGNGIITPVLRDLHWLPIRRRVDYKLALLVYKSLHGLAPPYLDDDCILASSDEFRRRLRSADVDTCIVPRTVPVLVTGISPLPAPGSGTAYRRICGGQTLSLANSVDY